MSENENVFRDAPVRKAVVQMAVPTVISSLVLVVYNMADTYDYARDYLIYIALGAPFILFANTFGHAVRGEGAAKGSMVGGMIGTVVNIILDPLFILVFDMGTAGAAIATVIGNVCGCVYYLWYFREKSRRLSIYPGVLIRNPDVAGRVSAVGVPAGMNSALMSVATVLLNNALVSFGDKPLAAMGIVTKAYMLIAFIHMGIANGVQPLLGLSIVISLVLLFGCLKKAGTFVPSEQKAMEK